MIGFIKDYFIESEDEIPEKYREEVEKRLSSNYDVEEKVEDEVISGRMGERISDLDEIASAFGNNEDYYLGHGTTGGEEIIKLILEGGLKVKDQDSVRGYMDTLRGLDSTSLMFGEGSDSLFSMQKDKLDNWPHKNAEDIVIVAIPKKFTLRRIDVGESDLFEPFYIGNDEEGYKLRPEFIKGVYNATSKSFTPNENFYENLDSKKRDDLLKAIWQKYVKLFAEHSFVSPEDQYSPLSLNEEELRELSVEWYKVQLEKLRNDKTFNQDTLDESLTEIASQELLSDFSDTTKVVKNGIKKEADDKENTDEGWAIDDEW